MKTYFAALMTIAFMGFVGYQGYQLANNAKLQGPSAPATVSYEELSETIQLAEEKENPKVKPEEDKVAVPKHDVYPSTLNLEMPFYTQAPHSNWDYPWQEACEEASVLLVANLFNDMQLGLEAYNTELLRIIDWEEDTFGSYEHTTVAQTAQMMQENYGLMTVIHDNPSFEDIQAILNRGHLIIAPFAGKYLYNPNFHNGGPDYHMLVIKGYDADKMQIVTHDVGTRNGADYVYDWDVIENALHDWHDDDMLLGEPRLIEVIPS